MTTHAFPTKDPEHDFYWQSHDGYEIDVYTAICSCCKSLFQRDNHDDPVDGGGIWNQPECPICYREPLNKQPN